MVSFNLMVSFGYVIFIFFGGAVFKVNANRDLNLIKFANYTSNFGLHILMKS